MVHGGAGLLAFELHLIHARLEVGEARMRSFGNYKGVGTAVTYQRLLAACGGNQRVVCWTTYQCVLHSRCSDDELG